MNKRDIDEAMLDVREDQERQDEQIEENRQNIITVEEEIEQLAPSFERGEWLFSVSTTPEAGMYSLAKFMSAEEQQNECNAKHVECLRRLRWRPYM